MQQEPRSDTATPLGPQDPLQARGGRIPQLTGLAIVGLVILLVSAWLLPLVSEFSLVSDTMSELVLGRFGFIQTGAFLVAGLGILALARAIRITTQGVSGSALGSLLIGIYGAGAILVALFPTDRIDGPADVWAQSSVGMIHLIVSLISFVCGIAGMFVLARTFMLAECWRAHSLWLKILPGVALALFFVQSEGPVVGLLQRFLVTAISTWLILVALMIRSAATTRTAPVIRE